jgi:hypothetical protein
MSGRRIEWRWLSRPGAGKTGPMPSPLDTVETYFLAKDGNRPFLMRRVFDPDIDLEIIVKTDAIAFPARIGPGSDKARRTRAHSSSPCVGRSLFASGPSDGIV